MKKAVVLLAVVAVLAMAGQARGDWTGTSYAWNTTIGDWSVASNWSPEGVPDGTSEEDSDKAHVVNGGTVQITGDQSCFYFAVGGDYYDGTNWHHGPGHAVMTGGSLQLYGSGNGGLYIGGYVNNTDPNNLCTFTQTAGDIGNIAYARVKIAGANAWHKGLGKYTISGGSVRGWFNLGYERWWGQGIATFRVEGTGPTSIKPYGYIQGARSTLEIALNDDGEVTVIDVTGDATLSGTLKLEYLGSYEPEVGDTVTVMTATGTVTYKNHTTLYRYFDGTNWVETTLPDLVLDAPDGWIFDPDYPSGGNSLVLKYVPEPATLVLLGLGGCLTLLRRRK